MCGCKASFNGDCGCKSNVTGNKKVHPSKAHKSKSDSFNPDENGHQFQMESNGIYGESMDGFDNADGPSNDHTVMSKDSVATTTDKKTFEEKLNNLATKGSATYQKGTGIFSKISEGINSLKGGQTSQQGSSTPQDTNPAPAETSYTGLYIGIGVVVVIVSLVVYFKFIKK